MEVQALCSTRVCLLGTVSQWDHTCRTGRQAPVEVSNEEVLYRYDRVDVYALGGMVESPSDGHALIFTKGWHPTAETFTYMKHVFKRWHCRQSYRHQHAATLLEQQYALQVDHSISTPYLWLPVAHVANADATPSSWVFAFDSNASRFKLR